MGLEPLSPRNAEECVAAEAAGVAGRSGYLLNLSHRRRLYGNMVKPRGHEGISAKQQLGEKCLPMRFNRQLIVRLLQKISNQQPYLSGVMRGTNAPLTRFFGGSGRRSQKCHITFVGALHHKAIGSGTLEANLGDPACVRFSAPSKAPWGDLGGPWG